MFYFVVVPSCRSLTSRPSHALDELLDAGHIEMTDGDGHYYRAIDIKGKKKAYALLDD